MAQINPSAIGLTNISVLIKRDISKVKTNQAGRPLLSQEAELTLERFMEDFVYVYCENFMINNEVIQEQLIKSVKNTLEAMDVASAFVIREEDFEIDKGL